MPECHYNKTTHQLVSSMSFSQIRRHPPLYPASDCRTSLSRLSRLHPFSSPTRCTRLDEAPGPKPRGTRGLGTSGSQRRHSSSYTGAP